MVTVRSSLLPFEIECQRVRGQYLEMPGLHLTIDQAQRLLDLDAQTVSLVLGRLVGDGFLTRARDGGFVRT